MQAITFFDKEADLQQLTGLTHEQLWEQGFDLDDWDWGFAAEEDYVKEYPGEFGGTSFQIKYDIPSYIYLQPYYTRHLSICKVFFNVF